MSGPSRHNDVRQIRMLSAICGGSMAWDDQAVEQTKRKPTIWDHASGYRTVKLANIRLKDGDAEWVPARRGTTWRVVQPSVWIAGVTGLAVAASRSMGAVVFWLSFNAVLAAVFLLVAAWVLRYVGARRVIFTDEWVGVRRRGAVDFVPYEQIGTLRALHGSRRPEWERFPFTGTLMIDRKDGLPIRLPGLLTYTTRDRSSFLSFVWDQALKRSLPIEPTLDD